jgi:hypothetical protein
MFFFWNLGFGTWNLLFTGCGAAWLARPDLVGKVGSSNADVLFWNLEFVIWNL